VPHNQGSKLVVCGGYEVLWIDTVPEVGGATDLFAIFHQTARSNERLVATSHPCVDAFSEYRAYPVLELFYCAIIGHRTVEDPQIS
jgi:hypothetical protein